MIEKKDEALKQREKLLGDVDETGKKATLAPLAQPGDAKPTDPLDLLDSDAAQGRFEQVKQKLYDDIMGEVRRGLSDAFIYIFNFKIFFRFCFRIREGCAQHACPAF